MNKTPLVSIISPCYNGEKYIFRLFDAILNQTYKNIEFIFVNDGSTDNTEEVALSYKSKFKKRGIDFIYINQKNGGQASAINQGLKVFKGDYLTWPDSDDWFTSDSIEKKVDYLEKNKDKGLVFTAVSSVDEKNLKVVETFHRRQNQEESLFDDLILEKNVFYAPVCYMVRTKYFERSVPQKQIYPSRAGQNWQMLLPIAHDYDCGIIDEPLCFYLIRNSSHSRQEKSVSDCLLKFQNHEDILTHVISEMNITGEEKKRYLKIIRQKYLIRYFELCCTEYKNSNTKRLYKELKKEKLTTFKRWLKYKKSTNKIFYLLYKILKG